MEIKLEQLGIEVVKRDPEFFKGMKPGDDKAIILNNGIAVVYHMEKRLGKKAIQMEVNVMESLVIDVDLALDDQGGEA